MTNLSSDPHSTPDRGLGWAPAPPTPAPAAAGSTAPHDANPFAVRHTAETIARLQMRQRLRDDTRTDDEYGAQGDRDPAGGGRDTTEQMIYRGNHWAETTWYEAAVYVSPEATDAELYAEIANVPQAMRRTRHVTDTDNTITSIIELDDAQHAP